MAIAVSDSFSSLETVSLIILSNITSNKVFWEYVCDECFLTVPGVFKLIRAHGSFSGFAMFNQNYFSVVQKKVQKNRYSQKILQFKYDIKKGELLKNR